MVKKLLARATMVMLGGVALWGCGERAPLQAPSVEVSDSAGVRFVHVPPLADFSLPEWRTRTLYSTRNIGGEELELFRVVDALFLPDSSLVLANSGSSELLIIDPEGRSVRRVGREGDGPGEFRRLTRLLPAAGGGFYAFDWRLSLFDDSGQFVRTRRLDPENRVVSVVPLAVLEDGRVVAVLGEQRIFQSEGVRRDTVPLMVFVPDRPTPDTLGIWLGLERAFERIPSGALLVPIGFSRTVYSASNGVSVVVGATDSLDLTVYTEGARPGLRLVAPPPSQVPTDEDVSNWRDQLAEDLPRDDPSVRRAYEAAPVRDRFPGFDGLEIDSEGRIWIGEFLRPGKDERRWMVFSPSGEPLGQVRLPRAAFSKFPGRTEVLAVGPDRVALLRRTWLDEQYVEVWSFEPRE